MGQNHIKNTELFLDKKLFFTSIDKMGTVNTYSKNTFWPTDSAASATAMATGKKVYNTFVASNFGKPIKSISEYVKDKNMGVDDKTPKAYKTKSLFDSFELITLAVKTPV